MNETRMTEGGRRKDMTVRFSSSCSNEDETREKDWTGWFFVFIYR